MINSNSHIIINAYKNASMVLKYHINIYSIQNKAESNNFNLTFKAAYS